MLKITNIFLCVLFVTVFAEIDKKWLDVCLSAHNNFRETEGKPLMQINETACEHATERATDLSERCAFDHSGNRNSIFGENLAAGLNDCEAIVKLWTDEKPLYDPNNTAWQPDAGHYTQVVWKDSLDLCCAQASHCKYTTITVCSYYPHGNIMGKFQENV